MINNVKGIIEYSEGDYSLRELIRRDYRFTKKVVNPITKEDKKNLKECLRECLCKKDVFIFFYKEEPIAIIQLEDKEDDEVFYRIIIQPNKKGEHLSSVENLFAKMLCKSNILDDTQPNVWLIVNNYENQNYIYLPIGKVI